MQATGRGPVHLLDAVVDGVEAPQLWNGVGEAVPPVVGDEHERDRERDRRRRRQVALEIERTNPEEGDRRHHYQRERGDGHEQVVHEEMREVGDDPLAEHLLASQREQLLERDEHEAQQGEAHDHPPAPEREREHERAHERETDHESALGRPVGIDAFRGDGFGSQRCSSHRAPVDLGRVSGPSSHCEGSVRCGAPRSPAPRRGPEESAPAGRAPRRRRRGRTPHRAGARRRPSRR